MLLSFIHGEGLVPFVLLMYGLAVAGWALVSYLLIKAWLKRKRKK
jgi:hypothetical protein